MAPDDPSVLPLPAAINHNGGTAAAAYGDAACLAHLETPAATSARRSSHGCGRHRPG